MNRRRELSSKPVELQPGDQELEMGVPIPGIIQSPDLWTQTGIKKLPESGPLSASTIFGRTAPIAVDIGCGNGRFAIGSALARPDWDHFAIDLLPTVIRYATRRGNQRGLSNVRFIVCDGWRFLDQFLATETVDEFHIYHPQPYADPGQVEKRLLSPAFFSLLIDRLKPGGKLFLQTDRRPYWDYISSIASQLMVWQEMPDGWGEEPLIRSRREMISVDQQLPVFRGVATRRSDLTASQLHEIAGQLPDPHFELAPQDQKLGSKRPNRSSHPRRRSSGGSKRNRR
ncbi:tRNA (guanine(46)-N(7))-methyltransferase TrmB [Pirellulaceae bacterium SH501]